MRHFVQNIGQFHRCNVRHSSFTVVVSMFEIDHVSFFLFNLQLSEMKLFRKFFIFDIWRNLFLNSYFAFQKIGVSENQHDSAEGVHGHYSDEEEAEAMAERRGPRGSPAAG